MDGKRQIIGELNNERITIELRDADHYGRAMFGKVFVNGIYVLDVQSDAGPTHPLWYTPILENDGTLWFELLRAYATNVTNYGNLDRMIWAMLQGSED